MVMTRQQKAAIMKHILEDLFDMDPDSDLHRAFSLYGARDPIMLISFPDNDLDAWQYKDDKNDLQPVIKGNIGLVKTFKAYVAHQACLGAPLGETDWLNISVDDFD